MAAVVAGAVVLVAVLALTTHRSAAPRRQPGTPVAVPAAPRPHPSQVKAPIRSSVPTTKPPPDPEPPSGAAANQIAIPALKVTAPIDIPCVDQGGEIAPPSTDPRRTCVWDGGAQLGARGGTAMILGHVNYSGVDGALGKIGRLHAGNRVYVWNSARQRSIWRVTHIHVRAKAAGVDPGAEVGPRGPARLVLVTCGGPWVGGHFGYADLVWVYASPA